MMLANRFSGENKRKGGMEGNEERIEEETEREKGERGKGLE